MCPNWWNPGSAWWDCMSNKTGANVVCGGSLCPVLRDPSPLMRFLYTMGRSFLYDALCGEASIFLLVPSVQEPQALRVT